MKKQKRFLRDALEIRKRALGDEHPAVGTSIYALGVVLLEKGDVDQSESVLNDAQTVWKKTLPEVHENDATVPCRHLKITNEKRRL